MAFDGFMGFFRAIGNAVREAVRRPVGRGTKPPAI
jgi:hypothetical protein